MPENDHQIPAVAALRASVTGTVFTPADDGWDAARQAWNVVADQRPALIVQAAAPGDIAATVRFARASGMRVAPQTTGHGATSMGDLSGAILLRMSRLDGVVVDPGARIAQVQAGASWHAVVAAAAEHGLVCLHGMSGGVGVAGYTLGGGIGWLARREGFASSHVRSLDVVTADGIKRHVDRDSEPDLFWALRGGGGGPAIVTSLEFGLFPLAEVYAGSLMWPIEQAPDIVHAYRAWIAAVPDMVTSTLKLVRFPPVEDIPAPLRGRALVAVTLAFTGEAGQGKAVVAPLRAIAAPYLDTVAPVPASALADLAGDPQDPMPGLGGALLLDALSADAADAFLAVAGPGVETPLISVEIRHLGGALRSPPQDPGAAGAVDAEILIYGVGVPATAEVGAAIGTAIEDMRRRFGPWTADRGTLLTFEERSSGLHGVFPPETADRLADITAAYDPDGLLLANQVAR